MGQQLCFILSILCGIFVFSLGQELGLFEPLKGSKHQEFDWELFKAINNASNESNLIVSTFSIKLLLSTIAEAGNTKTKNQIFNKLFPQVSQRFRDHDYYKNVLNSLKQESDQYKLHFGYKVYLDQSLTPKSTFLNVIRNIYSSEVEKVDFLKRKEAASAINEWTANKTNRNIKDLIKADDLIDVLSILVNTVYFKGTWENVFPKDKTKVEQFHVNSEKTVNVSMMHQLNDFYSYFYANNLGSGGAEALRLGYRGGKYAMTIILPKKIDDLNNVINSIDENKIKELQNNFARFDLINVQLSLPKFKFESTTHFKNILESIGITEIFKGSTPLPGLGTDDIIVSEVLQKTGINVDEKGTEIYAAALISLGYKSSPEEFSVNHPFMFFIEDEQTGIILFVGKVTDPTA